MVCPECIEQMALDGRLDLDRANDYVVAHLSKMDAR